MSGNNLSKYHIPPLWAMAVAAALFLLMAFQVITTGGSVLDASVYSAVSGLISPVMTKIVTVITHMGSQPVLISLCLVSCLLIWKAWGWKLMTVNGASLLLASLCNKLIKELVQRPRPELEQLVAQGGYSFPSGHSLSSMAFYGMLAIILLARLRGKKKYGIAALLGLLILLIGLSRIYVGVHFASDVLAGLCEGFVWIGLVSRIPWVADAIRGSGR